MAEASAKPGPLSGIRVADFTWAWAGPQASLLLSMLGAEVIKIESRARLDHARVHTLTAGSLTGGIDASPVFNDLNLGKHSLTLNLKKTGARDLVKKLVAHCDIVLQNMRPGVLDRMGLGYQELREIKPDLIMLSSSAVGATGPERTYTGYAPTFACLSGMVDISGHPDEPPIALSGSVDLRVGTASTFAVLAALIHRKRTGEGQNIDLSSTEVMSSMMGEAFVGVGLTGRLPQRVGNRDETLAPHGCYRSLDHSGDPQWVTIAVANETDWKALKSVVADPQLETAEFATRESRWSHQDALDEVIERWTAQRSNTESVQRLQAAGIAAAIVHSGKSLASDPHLSERGVYESVEHPLLGSVRVVGPPWKMQGAQIPGPAPLLGQHNEYVLKEILDLTGPEINGLIEDEVVF
jgi:benzylsuccinate CoA-transferase BbsF subunit